MIELDAEKVLSIPRRIKSREFVKSGFMNNYLFTDALGVIFHAPQEVIDIITSFTPVEPGKKANVTPQTAEDFSIDDDGEVSMTFNTSLAGLVGITTGMRQEIIVT